MPWKEKLGESAGSARREMLRELKFEKSIKEGENWRVERREEHYQKQEEWGTSVLLSCSQTGVLGSHSPYKTLSSHQWLMPCWWAVLHSTQDFTCFSPPFMWNHAERQSDLPVKSWNHYNRKTPLIIFRASLISAQCYWGKPGLWSELWLHQDISQPLQAPGVLKKQDTRCQFSTTWCQEGS